jgi:hypothetical protein
LERKEDIKKQESGGKALFSGKERRYKNKQEIGGKALKSGKERR